MYKVCNYVMCELTSIYFLLQIQRVARRIEIIFFPDATTINVEARLYNRMLDVGCMLSSHLLCFLAQNSTCVRSTQGINPVYLSPKLSDKNWLELQSILVF
jgi:hypothetical protein